MSEKAVPKFSLLGQNIVTSIKRIYKGVGHSSYENEGIHIGGTIGMDYRGGLDFTYFTQFYTYFTPFYSYQILFFTIAFFGPSGHR